MDKTNKNKTSPAHPLLPHPPPLSGLIRLLLVFPPTLCCYEIIHCRVSTGCDYKRTLPSEIHSSFVRSTFRICVYRRCKCNHLLILHVTGHEQVYIWAQASDSSPLFPKWSTAHMNVTEITSRFDPLAFKRVLQVMSK